MENIENKMSGEQKFWVAIWSFISMAVITVSVCTTYYNTVVELARIQAGYDQVQATGSQQILYRKK